MVKIHRSGPALKTFVSVYKHALTKPCDSNKTNLWCRFHELEKVPSFHFFYIYAFLENYILNMTDSNVNHASFSCSKRSKQVSYKTDSFETETIVM